MKKILVIDDDTDIAAVIRLSLAGKYIVESRTDGQGISELAKTLRPDLIIIDYYIGQQTAIELMGKFQNDEKTKIIPFMLLSGHQDIKHLAGVMGASSYLEKPFTLAALYKSIEEALCYKKD